MAQRPSMTVKDSERFIPNAAYLPTTGTAIDLKTRSNVIDLGEGDWKIEGTAVTATAAELNRAADTSARIVDATASTLAVTEALHDHKTVTFNRAAGVNTTLPAATGSGALFRFVVVTAFTGTCTIKVANASDTMIGLVLGLDGDGAPANAWTVGGTDDTITFDGAATPNMTQGGFAGDMYEIQDVAANKWLVRGFIKQTGTEATPMSATV
jgi:hypothetical protein